MKNIILVRLSFLFIIILSVGFSCQQNKSAQGNYTQTQGNDNTPAQKLRFISLQNGQVIKIGQNLSLKIKYDDTSKSPDSIQFQLDAIRIGAVKKTSEALEGLVGRKTAVSGPRGNGHALWHAFHRIRHR